MKLSLVVSTQPASFSALAYKGRVEESIAKAYGFGYDGVELAVRDPLLLDLVALKECLRGHGIPVPAIGTGQAYGEDGLSFTNADPAARERAIQRVISHIGLAEELGALVIIGLVRGRRPLGVSGAQAEDWLVDALRRCAAECGSVKLAIEPINRYETDLINTVESGLSLVDRVAAENVGLLLDTFHMNIEEPCIISSIIASRDRLFHFHAADSNRWYPGAGHLDFQEILETLANIGYSGFISAEILPLPDPDSAARNGICFLRKLQATTA